MQVILDEQTVELDGPSLGELLHAARKRLADGGRVVVEIAVDGHKLDDKQITDRQGEDVSAMSVAFTSADPKALAVETLEQVRSRLTDAEEDQKEAADLLQRDQKQNALQKVGSSIEAWLQVQQAVLQSTVLLGINLDDLSVDGEPAHALTTQAVERLNDVKEFIQADDTVALADSLEYEWPETTAKWHTLIDELIKAITA
ncbi:hypothetical protein [Algisphaera agarilytica]|uniref:Uncharacterized protein n=1 Tax=Algisphaera agarilytica TaxID=1385975 RepID=A0A7X0H342_9BACT|nr:hypothetical protein [Algisphaera agarilytica]MBB6428412.1 hypothetical protein [Algisphaera agarilytica]